jgi:hypothetical protein
MRSRMVSLYGARCSHFVRSRITLTLMDCCASKSENSLSGDKTRAKAAYKDFLTLWKDADPDIPILKEAKAEYAKPQ